MKKEKLKRIARRITAFAAAAAMAATFTFPTEIGDGFFDGFGNAIVASAETVGGFTISATNGGALTAGDDYSYDAVNGVLTIQSVTPITISGTTTDTIVVKKDINANITLAGVNIDVSGTDNACAFIIEDNSTGNVTITLADGSENTLKSGKNCAGLQKIGNGEGIGKLTIKSESGTGKLTANGGSGGAGIGGGSRASGSNITISGGIVTATGGTNSGAGIGGGFDSEGSNLAITGGIVTATGGIYGAGIGGGGWGPGSNITISGGVVTATGVVGGAGIGGGNSGSGSNIFICGGSVNAVAGTNANAIGGGQNGNGTVTPTLANGTTKVFLYRIDGARSIEIDGVTYPTTHNGDNSIYPYLSVGYHTVKIDETENTIHIAENGTITDPATPATQGAFEIYGGALDTDYSYSGGVLTIKTSTPLMIKNITPTTATTDRIEVEQNKNANITLAGVNISTTGAAFKIADDSTGNVTITLADGSENTLISGNSCAGLQKNGNAEGIGKLTIKGGTNGTGKLTATGGYYGAGIGGGSSGSGSDITISGGTVTATGGDYGAGIGGGSTGSGSDITISGGTVTATGGEDGAGIGGGESGSGSDITISGGTVTATGGEDGAGIGGGIYGSGSVITISGGTVTATGGNYGTGIGGGYCGEGSNITISGGAVTASGGYGGSGIGGGSHGSGSNITISGGTVTANKGYSGYGILIDSDSDITISGGSVNASSISWIPTNGTDKVYLLTISNPYSKEVLIDGISYTPVNHMALDSSDGKLYAYLPEKPISNPCVVEVGSKTTKYYYDTTKSAWLAIVDKPVSDTTTFTYDGTAKTYVVEANDAFYSISDNTTQTYAGEYQVTVSLNDTDKFIWNDGSYDDIVFDFVISKADPPAVKVPTATAITYGEALSASTLSDTNWSWVDGKVIPDVQNNGYPVKKTVDDSNYDYSDVEGYNSSTHTVTRTIAITVNKAFPTVKVPTASAITYGQALSDSTLSDTNWSWVGGTEIPTVQNSGYPAKITVDDSNYDYSGVEGYDSSTHTVTRTITVPAKKATPTITVTAAPTSDIAGKTIEASAAAVNPNNSALADLPAPALSYKVGNSGANTAFVGSFVIPEGTAEGTIITITAATAENSNYEAGAGTAIVTVTDCQHTDKTTVWEKDSTGHWHICNYCGAAVDKAEHIEDSGTVTTEPTETTEGVKTYKCTKCEYVIRTETIAVLDHTHVPSDDYSKDETGHWHTCSGCTEKLDFAAHTYGKWKITVPATAEANGKKERVCSVCGYVQEGTVIYGGDESTGDIDNGTDPDTNACHADLELTDEEIIEKIPLTPEELEAIENGADLEVYMVVIDYSGNVPAEDKALAEAVLTGDMQMGMYIDVTLFVKVGDNDPRAVTNTNGELKITFEMPEKLINTDKNTTRKYSIICVHNSEAAILDCAYDKTTAKGSFVTDKFSTYAIAYNDITEGKPAPVVRYPIVINGNVTVDKTTAAAGETVNVRTDFGYDIIVTAANGQRIAQITEKGSFTMPACKVSVTAVQNETFALMSTAWRNSYVYSYDADMNKIKVNSTKKRGVIIVNLGEEYAGRTFTIYSGRKSTKVKVTEGEFDENGKFIFEVPDGKNYTLVVED